MKISNLLAIFLLLGSIPAQAGELAKNWGLYNATSRSHVDMPRAWKLIKSSREIRVFVLDTGVDVSHPDLKGRICKPIRGNEYGWDFVQGRKNPTDLHGHGTHVAGIIRSIAPSACIVPVRYFSAIADGSLNLRNTVRAINYAIKNGADVINYSGGGTNFSHEEKQAIRRAEAAGIVFIAAAGNEYKNVDLIGGEFYPAAYRMSNLISVAATTIQNDLFIASNWGPRHIHVAAPGENILSTLPRNKYGYMSGTSQAAAFVTGLVSILLAEFPELKPHEIREILMSSGDKNINLKGKVFSGGKINAYKAIMRAQHFSLQKQESDL